MKERRLLVEHSFTRDGEYSSIYECIAMFYGLRRINTLEKNSVDYLNIYESYYFEYIPDDATLFNNEEKRSLYYLIYELFAEDGVRLHIKLPEEGERLRRVFESRFKLKDESFLDMLMHNQSVRQKYTWKFKPDSSIINVNTKKYISSISEGIKSKIGFNLGYYEGTVTVYNSKIWFSIRGKSADVEIRTNSPEENSIIYRTMKEKPRVRGKFTIHYENLESFFVMLRNLEAKLEI